MNSHFGSQLIQSMKILRSYRYLFSQSTHNNLMDSELICNLTDRKIIVINGEETRKFIQGVMTNNIEELYQNGNQITKQTKIALYTMFLNPKGKAITDAIVFRPIIKNNGQLQRVTDQLWLDVSESCAQTLMKHLSRYTWKKNVSLQILDKNEDHPHMFGCITQNNPIIINPQNFKQQMKKAGTLNQIPSVSSTDQGNYANLSYYDPRTPLLGARVICDDQGFKTSKYQRIDIEFFNKLTMIQGISSSSVMKNKLPFMFNPDLFNGFSFRKGCYLGQQLVARAYHTGIVRRRIFPFTTKDQNCKIEEGTVLVDSDKNQIGKVVESYNGVGTVLCSYMPFLSKSWPLQFSSPSEGIVALPFAHQLQGYINQMHSKQNKLNEIDI